MKVRILCDIPVDPLLGMKKGIELEVIKFDDYQERSRGVRPGNPVWVQSPMKKSPVKLLPNEYEIIDDQ